MAVFIPEVNRRPHIFLSHSSKDKPTVSRLTDDLNVCEIDVWLDEREIKEGESLVKTISKGIEDSKYVGFVLSTNFLESKWVDEEVDAAFAKQMEIEEKILISILIEKIPVPLMMKGKLYISFLDEYYKALTKLAGLIHGISQATITDAIRYMNPQSLENVIDTLAYCGKDPYMIIPKDIFDEIAVTGLAEIHGERLTFPEQFLNKTNLSARAVHYLNRVQIGIRRDSRQQIQ